MRERQNRIMAVLQEKGEASVDELSLLCGRSAETIRRDIHELAETGRAQKIHGGVKLPVMRFENHFARRMQENANGKRAIGAALAKRIHSGDTIFMDTGSTTFYCAESLREKDGLCVITNSFDIAEVLGARKGIEVIMLGGTYYPDNRQMLGSIALRDVAFYRPDYAVITIGTMNETGVMDYNNQEAALATSMIEHAQQSLIVADHRKLGHCSAFKVADLEKIDVLITDQSPSATMNEALLAHDVEVEIAPRVMSPFTEIRGGLA